MTIRQETDTVMRLTGAEERQITLSDDGFLSRGYVIDRGRIVFKFRKRPDTDYDGEIRILNELQRLELGVNLQSVGWTAADGSYLGLHGVLGRSLERTRMAVAQKQDVGRQLGGFLRRLHAAAPEHVPVCSLADEIAAWQRRFLAGHEIFETHFTPGETARMTAFVMDEVPEALTGLGEKLVFSHGDLGDGNIYIDENGRVGVIDFNESGYLDEAADFMDISDADICGEMLDRYGADDTLRRKVQIRRTGRPMFVIGTYAELGEAAMERFLRQLRTWLKEGRTPL